MKLVKKNWEALKYKTGPEIERKGLEITNLLAIDSIGLGAGNEVRTRGLDLGKVALYQLSYTRPS